MTVNVVAVGKSIGQSQRWDWPFAANGLEQFYFLCVLQCVGYCRCTHAAVRTGQSRKGLAFMGQAGNGPARGSIDLEWNTPVRFDNCCRAGSKPRVNLTNLTQQARTNLETKLVL